MKETKNTKKTLKLNKETVMVLSPEELIRLRGGEDDDSRPTVYGKYTIGC